MTPFNEMSRIANPQTEGRLVNPRDWRDSRMESDLYWAQGFFLG
jgi:hypothetical protein